MDVQIYSFAILTSRHEEYEALHLHKHLHDFHELFILLDGGCDYMVEDRILQLKPYQLLHIPPAHFHQSFPSDEEKVYKRLVIQFYAPQHDLLQDCLTSLSFCDLTASEELFQAVQRILRYAQTLPDEAFNLLREGLFKELLLLLGQANKSSQPEKIQSNPIIKRAIAYVNAHLGTPFSLKEAAAACHVHPNYLSSLFHRITRVKFADYARNKQLLLARTYIQNGELPTQIFYKCGFTDYTSFSRSYHQNFGHPPSKDKKNNHPPA